ncbi:hypothetical protein Efla_004303 [Eimeria flavescens]
MQVLPEAAPKLFKEKAMPAPTQQQEQQQQQGQEEQQHHTEQQGDAVKQKEKLDASELIGPRGPYELGGPFPRGPQEHGGPPVVCHLRSRRTAPFYRAKKAESRMLLPAHHQRQQQKQQHKQQQQQQPQQQDIELHQLRGATRGDFHVCLRRHTGDSSESPAAAAAAAAATKTTAAPSPITPHASSSSSLLSSDDIAHQRAPVEAPSIQEAAANLQVQQMQWQQQQQQQQQAWLRGWTEVVMRAQQQLLLQVKEAVLLQPPLIAALPSLLLAAVPVCCIFCILAAGILPLCGFTPLVLGVSFLSGKLGDLAQERLRD